jgi:[ribosomal protein S5]-alanine N-acetyltransferase
MSIIKNMEYPTLESERMVLRVLTLDNAEEVFNHFSDSDVTRFMDIDPCKDIKEAEEMIRFHIEDLGCRWGMYDKNNGKFMGTLGFHYLRHKEDFIAEVGYDLSKEFWGKGFMTEAMKELILFGFTQMGLDIIDATVELDNERSIHLLKNLGFHQDLELKDNLLYFYLLKSNI